MHGQSPVPVSDTVCVPAPLPPMTLSVATFDPCEVGANTTLTVQFDPTATDAPQLLVCENWVWFVPVNVILVIGSATLPVLVTVTGCGPLAVFVCTLPNASDVGETE